MRVALGRVGQVHLGFDAGELRQQVAAGVLMAFEMGLLVLPDPVIQDLQRGGHRRAGGPLGSQLGQLPDRVLELVPLRQRPGGQQVVVGHQVQPGAGLLVPQQVLQRLAGADPVGAHGIAMQQRDQVLLPGVLELIRAEPRHRVIQCPDRAPPADDGGQHDLAVLLRAPHAASRFDR